MNPETKMEIGSERRQISSFKNYLDSYHQKTHRPFPLSQLPPIHRRVAADVSNSSPSTPRPPIVVPRNTPISPPLPTVAGPPATPTTATTSDAKVAFKKLQKQFEDTFTEDNKFNPRGHGK